jgi:hypothetical protein
MKFQGEKKMISSIPDYIIISKSEDNSKTVITIKPRKINGYDYFFMFFFLFGLGFLIATITTNHIDFTSIMAGLIFLGLFGKLIIEMWISLKETQVISINKNHLEISRKIKTRKSQHIDKKVIKDIKFEGIGLFGDYSKIYLSFKNILTVVGYKIPVIKTNENNLMIAEHHDEYLRKWITNYLKKKI